MGNLSDPQKAYLTTWLMEQRRLGASEPTVTSEDVSRAATAVPKSLLARRDGLLQAVFDRAPALGDALRHDEPAFFIVGSVMPENPHWAVQCYLMAATESVSFKEVETLIDFAKGQGLVQADSYELSLTFDGYSHLEEVNSKSSSSSQAFVAMWFGAEVAQAYNEGIEPAIKDAGYKPMRIDQKEHNNKIDDEIIAEIRRSRFLVADFTCGLVDSGGKDVAIPRGGVYYEAGFAQGLGIPVIWCCRQDHIDHVHFDTRQFNHITWSSPQELREKLRNRIGAVLGDGPLVALRA
ncbi:hypothetical protein HB773_04615 [Sinorhizobium meliloti]|nr:hypothetical protein HB773_04615 [Sinorhizobium meliloti]